MVNVWLRWRRQVAAALLGATTLGAAAHELPASVQAAMRRAQLPPEALVVQVIEVGAPAAAAPRLSHRAQQPVNPASLMKLYTTGAALELLGPAWSWATPVLTTGATVDGVLLGDLVIQGRGDPTLVIERLWLLMRQVQARGIREIRGDIVLDGSAFPAPNGEPGDFDGERYRPYNVQPDALLLNLKSITLTFTPDPARGVARVASDVNLAGVQIDATVPLAGNGNGDCGDWRGALKPDFTDPLRLRLTGVYPPGCGEKSWPIAYAEPRSYNARLVEAVWRDLGGKLLGRVRDGAVPAGAQALFEAASPPLASVIRDINKFSNNVMAQQLFLTLGLAVAPGSRAASAPAGTTEAAREVVRSQVRSRAACSDAEFSIDNGSGLSRQSRSSARCMAAWLQALWTSPVMPELASSLPLTGIDGTARRPGRLWGAALGRAHLKTGSLRDAMGLAGYVLGQSGRRYALVVIVNHPNAAAARPVLDALVQWATEDLDR